VSVGICVIVKSEVEERGQQSAGWWWYDFTQGAQALLIKLHEAET
jgi:hypothetical protein